MSHKYKLIDGKLVYIPDWVVLEDYLKNIKLIEKVKDANDFGHRTDAYELIKSTKVVAMSSMRQIQDSYYDYKECDEWN